MCVPPEAKVKREDSEGKAVGFGLFDILSILGRERVIARIDVALARLAPVN